MSRRPRVVAYIDGYNLYYGIREAGLDSARWLNLVAMCTALLRSDQQLITTRYFTTRVKNHPRREERQARYLDALEAVGGISIGYGHFLAKVVECKHCGATWQRSEEKKTDVNIAVAMLEDAYDDLYDHALVISGDSDLAPPVAAVRSRFGGKRVVVAFPPSRYSAELERVATASTRISPAVIRRSRLPRTVVTASGVEIVAPAGWLPEG